MEPYINTNVAKEPPIRLWKRNLLITIIVFLMVIFSFGVSAPNDFPKGQIITIKKGDSLKAISSQLKEYRIIRSAFILNNLIILKGGELGVLAGEYYFPRSLSVFEVSRNITKGISGFSRAKITIPEGSTIEEIAEIATKIFPKFNKERFIEISEPKEGYLFPDTYFLTTNSNEENLIEDMSQNFESKIKTLMPNINEFGRALNEVVIMASILEEEAKTTEDRRIISGILWKRIDIGMALQVDASFLKINGRKTFDLTLEDLKIDSPYNTYKYAGLPIGPISNPGLDSILAAINPKESDYLYYLSDRDDVMHYAKDFEGHKQNKFKYLK